MLQRLRGLVTRFQHRVLAGEVRHVVGYDPHGNEYYVVERTKEEPERREVEYKDDIPDPTQVPMPWYAWLRYRRDDAPTPAELRQYDVDAAALAARVRAIDEADAKMRRQEIAERSMGAGQGSSQYGDAATPISMASVMSAMSKDQYHGAGGPSQQHDPAAAADDKAADEPESAEDKARAKANATFRKPAPSEEPSGQGDEFQPGVWRPGKRKKRRG